MLTKVGGWPFLKILLGCPKYFAATVTTFALVNLLNIRHLFQQMNSDFLRKVHCK